MTIYTKIAGAMAISLVLFVGWQAVSRSAGAEERGKRIDELESTVERLDRGLRAWDLLQAKSAESDKIAADVERLGYQVDATQDPFEKLQLINKMRDQQQNGLLVIIEMQAAHSQLMQSVGPRGKDWNDIREVRAKRVKASRELEKLKTGD